MGNCTSSSKSTHSQSKESRGKYGLASSKTRMIDKQIKADKIRMKSEVKLLLLGAGESGKSTVLKQMRLIHAAGFDRYERENFRVIAFSNITSAAQTLLEATKKFNINLDDESLYSFYSMFEQETLLSEGSPYPTQYLEPLKRLWSDSGIQSTIERGNTFALHDNLSYFFEQLDRFWAIDYVPTDQDILRCRAKTTGIVETNFHIGPLTYRMFDVGGQRNERKKWIHCFENVTAIMFVVSISGYDQCLLEDKTANQMQESLMLFDNICNSPWFTNTSMILFLNKIDIFESKISTSPVSEWFPDYKGPANDSISAKQYFSDRFQRLNKRTTKKVYVHYTDATDTKLLEHVMSSVSDIILNDNLDTLML
ncbi:guanine nucleotide binding protein, alpha subunit [Spinellus fusiger]|nr:guanine nucleotide binding protein, alpha subunit [Spinellus fusiger]KAI7867466.1 guanine nucleotide binding protein, alpha subunit [Spinellus fusiger]